MLVSVSLGMFSHDMQAGWRSWWEQAARPSTPVLPRLTKPIWAGGAGYRGRLDFR